MKSVSVNLIDLDLYTYQINKITFGELIIKQKQNIKIYWHIRSKNIHALDRIAWIAIKVGPYSCDIIIYNTVCYELKKPVCNDHFLIITCLLFRRCVNNIWLINVCYQYSLHISLLFNNLYTTKCYICTKYLHTLLINIYM